MLLEGPEAEAVCRLVPAIEAQQQRARSATRMARAAVQQLSATGPLDKQRLLAVRQLFQDMQQQCQALDSLIKQYSRHLQPQTLAGTNQEASSASSTRQPQAACSKPSKQHGQQPTIALNRRSFISSWRR